MKVLKNPDFERRCDAARNTVEYKLERAMVDFTERICARLEELGMTQSKLAELMGVSRSQITNLLRGEYKNFTFETAIRLASALEMDFEPFLASRTGLSCKCGQIRVGIVEGVLKAKPNSTWRPAVMQHEYQVHEEGSLVYDSAAVANG